MIPEINLILLLRVAWIAGFLPFIIANIPFSNTNYFHHLLLSFTKRGKIMQSPSNKFTVPQKFFCHFYVLAVFWTMLQLSGTWFYAYSLASELEQHRYGIWSSVFMLLLMEAQVLRRLYECAYVFNYSPSARMHILSYLTGLLYYIAAPLSLCCNYAPDVFNFSLGLGKHQVQVPEIHLWSFVHPLMQLRWHAWVGAVLFIWRWIHQHRCHQVLGSLRESKKQADEYVIPYGDWFQYVSSLHYLAEIVIYFGHLVISGFSDLTIWLLLGFVVSNLVLAAAETQRWYMRKFDNYPRDRFAIFPFVY